MGVLQSIRSYMVGKQLNNLRTPNWASYNASEATWLANSLTVCGRPIGRPLRCLMCSREQCKSVNSLTVCGRPIGRPTRHQKLHGWQTAIGRPTKHQIGSSSPLQICSYFNWILESLSWISNLIAHTTVPYSTNPIGGDTSK